MKTIMIRNIDEETHRRFKALCAEKGMTMSDAMLGLITKSLMVRGFATNAIHKENATRE